MFLNNQSYVKIILTNFEEGSSVKNIMQKCLLLAITEQVAMGKQPQRHLLIGKEFADAFKSNIKETKRRRIADRFDRSHCKL